MRNRSVHLLDAAVPLVVGAVIALGGVLHGDGAARPLALAVGLGAAAALVARRRAPGWTPAVSGAPNTFRATVTFQRVGLYEVAVAGFDPRDPARFTDIGPPVRIEPAAPPAAPAANATSWPWALVVGLTIPALLAGAWSIQRPRARATG